MLNAAALAELLRGLVDQPREAWLWGPLEACESSWVEAGGMTVRVVLGSRGELAQVTRAQREGDVLWDWGCERNWEELGPPINPAELLSDGDREAVGTVLQSLPSLPGCGPVVWDFEAVGQRQRNWAKVLKARKRRSRRTSRGSGTKAGRA